MRRDQYQEQADPVKIGLLLDNPARHTDHAERIFDLVAEQYAASGRFERGFEFVKTYPWGPPAGFIQNSIDAFHELCDQGCIAVLGGNHADDCIAIPPHADARQTPFLGMGATAQGVSTWAFSISWGSIPHDVYTMASWLKKNGHTNIVMTWDRADHALENILHFRNACARTGIRILADERFPQLLVPISRRYSGEPWSGSSPSGPTPWPISEPARCLPAGRAMSPAPGGTSRGS